jgi:tetratricopeptide (TPR) repeat protein
LLATNGATVELAERVHAVRDAVDEARRDSGLLAELERIPLEKAAVKENHYDEARAVARYAALLQEYGVDPAAPAAAAARVRGSRLREALLATLEDWRRLAPDAAEKERLEAVLRLAEPAADAFRHRWLMAVRQHDDATLVQLADAPAVQELPVPAILNLARDLTSAKQLAAAERLLREARERHPGSFWLNHDLGKVLLLLQPPRAEEAVRYLTAAVALRRDSPGVYLNLGNALLAVKDMDGAVRACQAALAIDPAYAPAHTNLGNALHRKNDREGAIREYQAALAINPESVMARRNLGQSLHEKKDLEGAIRQYQAALAIDPDDAKVHMALGMALRDKKDLDGAIAEYLAALRIEPDDAKAHTNLGVALYDKKDLDGAIREYEAALKIDPDHARARINLGNALGDKGDLEGAIREYQAAVKVDPNFAPAYYSLGLTLRRKNNLEGAIGAYQAAVKADPNHATAHYSLANALRDKKDFDGAIGEYQAALRIAPKYAEAYCNVGEVFKRQGRFEDALAALRTGHKLGSQRPGWPYASATWIRQVEQLIELDNKLAKELRGEAVTANATERLQLASYCQRYKKLYARAAGWYADAFAAQPHAAEDLTARHRYDAACAAALAASGGGHDAGQLNGDERARLRQQASDWLRADLAIYAKRLERPNPQDRRTVQEHLKQWKTDDDLIGTRDFAALIKLPAGERAAWMQLWADVETLLSKASAAKKD